MRKWILVGVVCLSSLFLLRVYATTAPVTATWTVRLAENHGLMAGDAVEEAGARIGQVVEVAPHTVPDGESGFDVFITLDRSHQDRLRERSTFFIATPPGSTRPVLTLVVFDEKSPVLPPGSRITGVGSEMELEVKRQLAALDSTVRGVVQQLDILRQVLDNTSKSEEKRKLEESIEGLAATIHRTRNDFIRIVTEEIARWKKLFDKFFPSEAEKMKTV
jgi:ABC-type transporter Mla subunit MlaD